MTREELAAKLNGREYGSEIGKTEEKLAKEAGLVVVFGYSDDNVEFRGAFDDEIGAWNGTTVLITKAGPIPEHDCDCEYCGYKTLIATAASVEAVWNDNGIPWEMKTALPHSVFEIVEDGEPFCRGIVIDVKDIPA